MIHARSALGKLTLAADNVLRDNEREAMLMLLEDMCDSVHYMLFAACDKHCYRQLGAVGHEGYSNNLKMELSKVASLFKASSTGYLSLALAPASPVARPAKLVNECLCHGVRRGKGWEPSINGTDASQRWLYCNES